MASFKGTPPIDSGTVTAKRPERRPSWQPTNQQRRIVQAMAANGIPQESIAKMLGVAAKTLRKHCKTELAIGKTIAIFRVADALFKMAIDPNGGAASVAAAIFFLEARAGWKETGVNHHTTDRA
jgi:hypothetical protein